MTDPQYGTPPAGWDHSPAAGGPGSRKRNGFGIAALVLGILAVVTSITVIGGVVLGILAIIFGALGRSRAKRGEADNGGVALAGLVLGVIGLLASVALIAFGLSILNSDEGQKYQDCVKKAGDDRAAVQSCAEQFNRDITS